MLVLPVPTIRQGPESVSTGGLTHMALACWSAEHWALLPSPCLLSPQCLCHQEHLSSATSSSQGSLCFPSPGLLPCSSPSVLWLGARTPPAWLNSIHITVLGTASAREELKSTHPHFGNVWVQIPGLIKKLRSDTWDFLVLFEEFEGTSGFSQKQTMLSKVFVNGCQH